MLQPKSREPIPYKDMKIDVNGVEFEPVEELKVLNNTTIYLAEDGTAHTVKHESLIERLENKRKELEMNYKDFCEHIDISQQSYSTWRNRRIIPNNSKGRKAVMTVLGVSEGEAKELCRDKTQPEDFEYGKTNIKRRIKKLDQNREKIEELANRGLTRKEIAKEIGVKQSTLSKYLLDEGISDMVKYEPTVKKQKNEIQNVLKVPTSFVPSPNMVVWQWYVVWFQTYRLPTIRKVTASKYAAHFESLFKSELGQMTLENVKRVDAQKLINEYGATHSKITVRDFMQRLKGLFNDAQQDGLITLNPFTNLSLMYREKHLTPIEMKEKRDEKKWLEMDEYLKLKEFLVNRLTGIFLNTLEKTDPILVMRLMFTLVALKSGARVSELLGLTYSDLDFFEFSINIDKTWDYKNLTGFQSTKNISSIRKVKLDKETMLLLKEYVNWIGENVETEMSTLFVFKDRRYHNSNANDFLKKLLIDLDIEPITYHKLRHTQASILIANQVPEQLVAKRLGHTDVGMVRKVYGHLLEKTENEGNDLIMNLI